MSREYVVFVVVAIAGRLAYILCCVGLMIILALPIWDQPCQQWVLLDLCLLRRLSWISNHSEARSNCWKDWVVHASGVLDLQRGADMPVKFVF